MRDKSLTTQSFCNTKKVYEQFRSFFLHYFKKELENVVEVMTLSLHKVDVLYCNKAKFKQKRQ